MQTRYNNHDSNIINIVFDKVPQTGTLSKLSAALDLLDASVNAICDARIATALDTSSIQTLWAVFDEYDFTTAAALTDLDYRLSSLDASLVSFGTSAAQKYVSIDSSLSGLQTGLSDLSTALYQHINDTSAISGSVKPEDIERYIAPLRLDIYNTSVYLSGRIDNTASDMADVINNAVESLNTSVGQIKYFDAIRDASIASLKEYQTNTVDSLLTSYSERVNSAESIAIDSKAIAEDVSAHLRQTLEVQNSSITTALTSTLASVDNKVSAINSSVSGVVTDIYNEFRTFEDVVEERDFVTASALTLHDSSIIYILGVLRQNGLIQ